MDYVPIASLIRLLYYLPKENGKERNLKAIGVA
jgi:hypothetical protein